MNDPERDDWPSAETDDRCSHCAAGEGEPCEAECRCGNCLWHREFARRMAELDVVAGE